MLVRAAPGGDSGVGVERDDRLLAERERELLAFRRLDEERRLQAGRANRLLVAREHRCRRGNARGGALDRQPLLATQADDDLGVVGQGHVGELADDSPIPKHEGDVLVALREEDRSLLEAAQELEHLLVRSDEAFASEVARTKPELALVDRESMHGNALAAERPRQREAGVELAEDDRRPHASPCQSFRAGATLSRVLTVAAAKPPRPPYRHRKRRLIRAPARRPQASGR